MIDMAKRRKQIADNKTKWHRVGNIVGKHAHETVLWRSVAELAHDAQVCQNKNDSGSIGNLADPYHSPDWYGTETFEQAIEFCKGGWQPEDKHLIADMYAELQGSEFTASKTTHIMDVQGGAVDMGMFMAGEPECMIDFVPQSQKELLTFVVCIGQSSGISGETALQRGLGLMALIHQMRTLGYQCDIYVNGQNETYAEKPTRDGVVLDQHYSQMEKLDFCCKVSDYRFPESDEVITFALSNPAMLRRLLFAIRDGYSPNTIKDSGVQGSYGQSRRDAVLPQTLAHVSVEDTRKVIVIPPLDHDDNGLDWRAHYSAARHILAKTIEINEGQPA